MTASMWAVARKDFEDAMRSRMVWSLTAVFVGFLVMALPAAGQLFPEAVTVTPRKALSGVAILAQLFVPGIALVAGYYAVVGERESGSLRILLAYPFDRGDVVAGKLVGRLLVTGVALLGGFVAASVLVVVLYGTPEWRVFAGFVGNGLLLGVVFTAIAVGGSAAAATRGKAMALTIGPFVFMVFFWKAVNVGLYYAVTGSIPGIQAEPWYFFLKRLNPLEAFRVLSEWVLDEPVQAAPKFPLEDVPPNTPPEQLVIGNRIAGPVPVYLEEWVSVVVLLGWAVVFVGVGWWRFTRTDLG